MIKFRLRARHHDLDQTDRSVVQCANARVRVRFGSKADMCVAKPHVRLTPDSDRESGHAQMVVSALPLKAVQRLMSAKGQ
jgi:hypothetical protein